MWVYTLYTESFSVSWQVGRRETCILTQVAGSQVQSLSVSLPATPTQSAVALGQGIYGFLLKFAEEAEAVTELTLNSNYSYFSVLSVSAALSSLLQSCLGQVVQHNSRYLSINQVSLEYFTQVVEASP